MVSVLKHGSTGFLLLVWLACPRIAAAGGYALIERDAAGMGRAYAGQAAVTGPEAIAFNPAALPERTTASASLHGLRTTFEPEDAGQPAVVPTVYGASRGIGVGLYANFGLSTDYPDDWTGRYSALYSGIRTARAHVAAAHSLNSSIRIGAGLFVQHFEAELTQAYPLGMRDGRVKVEGDDIGVGWSIGTLLTPRPNLDLGVAFSSVVHHELRGTANLPNGSTSARVKVATPESVTLGAKWRARPDLALLAGLSWTRWSRLQSLDIHLGTGGSLFEEHAWRDTWRLDLGGEIERGPWTWRLGTAWDQSPIRSAEYRTPRLPDSDRIWLSAGIGYQAGDWSLNASYAHVWFAGGRGTHPAVDYTTSTDILALGVTRTW
jgi:long-chain fatty acid transport protein